MSHLTPANSYQRAGAEKSVAVLRDALILAKIAGCPKLCRAIRHAIKSGGGALRHMERRRDEYARLHQLRPAYPLIKLPFTPAVSAATFRAVTQKAIAAFSAPQNIPFTKFSRPVPANYRFPYKEDSFK